MLSSSFCFFCLASCVRVYFACCFFFLVADSSCWCPAPSVRESGREDFSGSSQVRRCPMDNWMRHQGTCHRTPAEPQHWYFRILLSGRQILGIPSGDYSSWKATSSSAIVRALHCQNNCWWKGVSCISTQYTDIGQWDNQDSRAPKKVSSRPDKFLGR